MIKISSLIDMRKNLIICLLSSLFLIGCAVYHPQTTDIPLIDHKGDLRIDVGASVIPSAHSTISYGLTNKIALQSYGSIGVEDRYYFQFSPGLYKCVNKKVIELYSGFGMGHANTVKNPLSNLPEAIKQSLFGNYQIYFVQFNWGKNTTESKKLDWGLGLKTGLFHSNLTDGNYYSIYSPETGPFTTNIDNSILVEPIFCLRSGNEKAKFTYKFAFTKIIKLDNPDNIIPAPMINMSLGVNFKIK
jgi:hypothetical protein